MRVLDIPPVWLIVALIGVWGLATYVPGATVHWGWLRPLAMALFAAGLVLMGLAVIGMQRARTTFIPRREASALVTGGVFRFSRNPIYLGDWLVLLAAIFWWGAVLALPLLWVFPKVIEKRFITGEEDALRAKFGDQYEAWAKKVRRWV